MKKYSNLSKLPISGGQIQKIKKVLKGMTIALVAFGFFACKHDVKTSSTTVTTDGVPDDLSSTVYKGETGPTDENVRRDKNEVWLFMNED